MNIKKQLNFLALGSLSAIALTSSISLFVVSNLSFRMSELTDNAMPSISSMSALSQSLGRMRAEASLISISKDQKFKEKRVQSYEEAKHSIRNEVNHYQKNLVYDSTDKENITEVQRTLELVIKDLDRSIELSLSGDTESAQEILTSGVDDAVNARKSIDQESNYNLQLGQQFSQRAKQAEKDGFLYAVSSFIITSFLLFIFIFKLSHRITSPARILSENSQIALTTKDLTVDFGVSNDDEIGSAVSAISRFFSSISQSFSAIQQASFQVVDSSAKLNDISQASSASSSAQSLAANSMAAGVEELSVSISTVNHQASESKKIADSSALLAQQGLVEINQLLETIYERQKSTADTAINIETLEQSATNISKITSAIASIASQTNLLALNAAIEAARAGESGRGFAVVADEVRKLAEQTRLSTSEISGTITSMQQLTKTAAEQARSLASRSIQDTAQVEALEATMKGISQSFSTVRDLSTQISEAMKEQNLGALQVAAQVESVAKGAEISQQTSKDAAESAQKLSHVATKVSQLISEYKIKV